MSTKIQNAREADLLRAYERGRFWFGVYAGLRSGLLAGLIPAGVAILANGHADDHAQMFGLFCVSWCSVACATGGALAGMVIARRAGIWRLSAEYWVTASASALATAGLVCTCFGLGTILAVAMGVGASALVTRQYHVLRG